MDALLDDELETDEVDTLKLLLLVEMDDSDDVLDCDDADDWLLDDVLIELIDELDE